MKRQTLALWSTVLLLVAVLPALAVNGSIHGRVIDADTREPLPGANIQILGTLRGASADPDGRFEIDRIPPGIYTVRVSMIGFRAHSVENIRVQPQRSTELTAELQQTAIQFDPIVVLAGKTQQRLDQASVSISVVSSSEIERRNPMDLQQALESAPGVHFVGNQINIRGSTGYTFGAGNKVLLLLDGVPVHASDTGEFNWDMLPPLDVEQIEVLKGAGSTLWGSSALGGVVNVITKDPSPQGKLMFSASAGRYDKPVFSEWSWTDPDRLHYTRTDVSYSRRYKSLGLRISVGRFATTGYTELGDAQKSNLTGKVDYRFANGIKWTGFAAYSHIDRGFFVQWFGQNDPYQVDPKNLDNRAKTHQISAYSKLAIPFSARFAINLRASFVRTLMGNQFGQGAGFNPAIGQGFEVQADWIPQSNHTLTAGVQVQYDAGSTKYFGDHTGYFIGPYLQDEWKIGGDLRLTAGFRYDRYQLIDGQKEDLFSPRLGLNWQPWESTSLRASVGSGFRAATIVERFLELSVMNFKIIANPDLKSESSWAYDLGFRQYLTPNWNIDLSLFNNEYWEMVEAHLDLIRGQIQFRNIPRATIRGVEATSNLSSEVALLGRSWIPALQLSLTAMDHRDRQWDEALPYRPKVLASAKASLKTGAVQVEIDYRYAARIDAVKVYPINDRVPMKFVDGRVSWRWKSYSLQLGINNIFQYNYAPMESNLMPMRHVTIGVKGEL
ncbi:TonB-dependent receptor [candidate division KSB1 bacterium]|nr:TonB-dependent receptor [candidate division KSB1 bacterium]